MKNFIFFTALMVVTAILGFSQVPLSFDFTYEVHKIYPSFPIDKVIIAKANTLKDLNMHYKAEWVKEYVNVEIATTIKGEKVLALSNSIVLSKEQKQNLIAADYGEDIVVSVKYLPENTLPYNDVKEMNFTLTGMPENDAKFKGEQTALLKHLNEHVIAQLDKSKFTKYNITAVKFTVDENGKVGNEHIFESSKDEEIDNLLLETICNMPAWEPATYANGQETKQEFVLILGDTQSCNMYRLNIGLF